MARGGARPRAGAPRQPHRATIARLDGEMVEAARQIVTAQQQGRKLAKDVLEEFMNLFAGMAAYYQPAPPNMPPNPQANEKKFGAYAELAVYTASRLAPYQSPTFRAIMITPPAPEQHGEERKRFTLTIFEGGKPAAIANVEPRQIERKPPR